MENLIVDRAYTCREYPENVIVEVDGEFYLLPSIHRTTNDLNAFKKISKDIVKNKELIEFPNYRYPTKGFEKKDGVEIRIGRSISGKEFEELKEEIKLSDDDISEPYETVRGAVYGKKSEKKFKCIQIKVEDILGCEIENKLKRKGIQADNISSGRIEIRIPDETLKEFRERIGMSQTEFSFYFGLSVRNVQEWEQSKKSEPPYLLDLLKRIWKLEKIK